jgi:hypothetical protein
MYLKKRRDYSSQVFQAGDGRKYKWKINGGYPLVSIENGWKDKTEKLRSPNSISHIAGHR